VEFLDNAYLGNR